MNTNRVLSQNKYGAYFFKQAWEVVGNDVIQAIKHFFDTNHLLKEVSSTILTLMPKVSNLSTCHDFKLIGCCNTIYKRI